MSELDDFRDRHKGRKCYVFGSGPSLNRFDCDKMALDGVSICCNASIMAVERCDYFLFTDGRVPKEKAYYTSIFDKAGMVIVGNQDLYNMCIGEIDPALRGRVVVPSPKRRQLCQGFNFALQDHHQLVVGGAVIVATHLAHIMGCSPIIMVGVDYRWNDGQKYFHARDDRALWPSLGSEDEQKTDTSLGVELEHWENIKAKNPALPVLVANPQSKLCDMFPAIGLSEFLKTDCVVKL